jgi:hypothetical protein
MAAINSIDKENVQANNGSVKKGNAIPFSSFLKAIKENSDMRKQVDDIIDLFLYDNQFHQNNDIIRSTIQSSEAKTVELMMQLIIGEVNYLEFSKIVHKNRIIRALTAKDKEEHTDLLNRVAHLKTAGDLKSQN